MNIFEALGLDKKHRRQSFQLVKHHEELTDTQKTLFPRYLERKYDGMAFGAVVVNRKCIGLFSRSSNRFTNLESLHHWFDNRPDGVYFGEVYCEKSVMSLQELSGFISTNRKKPLSPMEKDILESNLRMVVFDFVTLDEFIEGKAERAQTERIKLLRQYLEFYNPNIVARYRGALHEPERYVVYSTEEAEFLANNIIEGGTMTQNEGVVLKVIDAPWVAGHKRFHWSKIVKKTEYDLEVIDVEEGKGKHEGLVSVLLLKFQNGKIVRASAGKNYTLDRLKEMYDSHIDGSYPLIGRVFRVKALCIDSKGGLRLPKFEDERFDKATGDF